MRNLIEYALEDGSLVRVEGGDGVFEGPVTRGLSGPVEKAAQTFETALESIRPAASAVVAKMSHLDVRPDSVQVEFGVKLSAQVGAIIASAAGEGHFIVRLSWSRPAAREASDGERR